MVIFHSYVTNYQRVNVVYVDIDMLTDVASEAQMSHSQRWHGAFGQNML